MQTPSEILSKHSRPGCGIVIGITPDNQHAALAYFITDLNRSSRSRVLALDGDDVQIQAFDGSKITPPELFLYRPVRVLGGRTIVSNGTQTDELYQALVGGKTFCQSLQNNALKTPVPHDTPRIAATLTLTDTGAAYELALIKHAHAESLSVERSFFQYPNPLPGEGRLLFARQNDPPSLPMYETAPSVVKIENDLKTFAHRIWDALDETNRVSLFARFLNIASGTHQTRIINKLYTTPPKRGKGQST